MALSQTPIHSVPNTPLVNLIPLNAKRVLEVGCSSGATGAQYLRRNPRAHYAGLEIDETFAAQAAAHLHEVKVGNIETLNLSEAFAQTPEVMVFGDVLEHLQDPWGLLKKLHDWLPENGTIVARIPNIAHWSIIQSLLAGQWHYQDSGLLDKTHLRFFTRRSIQQAFTQAGWHIDGIMPRHGAAHKPPDAVFAAMQNLAETLGVKNPNLMQDLAPLQWLVRASKRPVRRLMINGHPHRPLGGMADVRLHQPLQALASLPGVFLNYFGAEMRLPQKLDDADNLYIWQRPLSTPQSREITQKIQARGVPVIIEFDDDPKIWKENVADNHRVFGLANGTQTSTAPLKKLFSAHAQEIGEFDNGIFELPLLRNYDATRRADGKVVFFFGALNREADWAPYLPALTALLQKHDAQIHCEIVFDKKLFDALPASSKNFTPLCDYAAYQALLAQADFSWLPLQDNEKNQCKTDLKFLECASYGVAALCSRVVYERSVTHEHTGLFYLDEASFTAQFERLVLDAALRQALASKAYDYVRQNRMLAYDVDKRLDWYRRLNQNFASHQPYKQELPQ